MRAGIACGNVQAKSRAVLGGGTVAKGSGGGDGGGRGGEKLSKGRDETLKAIATSGVLSYATRLPTLQW